MLVKCPQCNALLEATPGKSARCRECGFAGEVGGGAPQPIHERAREIIATPQVSRDDLAAPFAFLSGLSAVATFYLADLAIPFVLAVAALGLALYAERKTRRTRQTVTAMALAGVALVLSVVALVA